MTPATAATPIDRSRYAIASIVVAVIDLLLFPLMAVFDLHWTWEKWERVTLVTAVLSIILAFAAYRQRTRKRMLAHVAMALAIFAFVAHLLIVPL